MSALSLDAAKDHLNIEVDTYDYELQAIINSAEGIIAGYVGPLTPTTMTDRAWSNGYQITLRTTPVISLTSVSSVYAVQSADVSSLFVSPAGVLTWANARNYFFGGWYDVTYVAGRATVPDALLFAIKEVVHTLWMTQRGPRSGGGGAPLAARITLPVGYSPETLLNPNARIAMEPYVQDFGFA